MSVGSGGGANAEPEPMMEMNMTPMIDVLLVLIILLIITIPKANHSVNLNMPTPNPNQVTPPTPPVVVQIDVDFDGTILVDGQVVPNRPALEQKLAAIAAQADQPEVHLRPNKLVPYKVVAGVMAAAQRLGVTKIGMVGQEQFQ
jgi:biopolymer transport protein ExbD